LGFSGSVVRWFGGGVVPALALVLLQHCCPALMQQPVMHAFIDSAVAIAC
jgi:hypothetical protein